MNLIYTQAEMDEKDARIRELEAALRNLIREAKAVADDCHHPRYFRLDESLASASSTLETKVEFPDPPQCSFCGRTEPEHLKLNHVFMVGGSTLNRQEKP